MSIIIAKLPIKEMPKSCFDCVLCNHGKDLCPFGTDLTMRQWENLSTEEQLKIANGRNPGCPLVEEEEHTMKWEWCIKLNAYRCSNCHTHWEYPLNYCPCCGYKQEETIW